MLANPGKKPDLSYEMKYDGPVCGLDEAGRGPLAGPVVAGCVHIPEKASGEPFWQHVTDSKKLSAAKRVRLEESIRAHASFGIGMASSEEIDALNIHQATLLAMKRAFQELCRGIGLMPKAVLVDGNFIPDVALPGQAIKKGDSLSLSIAAASILAKVARDRLMTELHDRHPVYGWSNNAGYGTPEHLEALRIHGVTIHHRRSFAPVREAANKN